VFLVKSRDASLSHILEYYFQRTLDFLSK
jgi:hypothetical protein